MTHDTVARAEQLLELRELVLAFSLFNRAEAEGCDPERCAAGRWMIFMLSGDYTAAWLESDAIRARCRPDVHRFWQGEDLHGKRVLVRCLHGFGDSVQMLRFVPALKELGVVRVIVECAPHAVELVKCLPGTAEVITWGAHAPLVAPEFDVQVEVMELPYIVRATVSTLPSAAGMLRLPIDVLQQASHAVHTQSSRPRVGLVWSAGEWNPARSVPLELLTPILHNSNIEFWNLQGGSMRNDWDRLPAAPNLRDLTEFTDAGLVRLSALIAHLDLVITVDTLAAHLAGTLNVPCFLLLQHAADWRWMIDRADSPWYPSLRLFRQPRPGDWQSAVVELNTSLSAMAHNSQVEPTAA